MAHAQLHLIDILSVDDDLAADVFKLDDRTIQVGRKGLADARAALARSSRRRPDVEHRPAA